MAVDKKTIAYILIGVAVAGGAYYLYNKNRAGNPASLGAGQPDTRGTWGADDDAVYTAMRSKFSAVDNPALGWIDPAVKKRYEGTDGIPNERVRFIKGARSKAGAFLSVFEEVMPNEKGKYKLNSNDPSSGASASPSERRLWAFSLHDELWNMYNNLQIKHGAL